jgi:hypothetical protein
MMLTRTGILAATVVAAILTLFGKPAHAYPQFAFKGLGDCGSCHHSPSGGGFPSRWGRESLDVTFGPDSGLGPVNDDLAYDPAHPSDVRVDLGADVRILPLFGTDGDGSLGPAFIPMLTEVGGAVAIGRLVAYAAVTAKKIPDEPPYYILASREHWLGYQVDAGIDVRAGRLVLPFGIRQPDHTQYVREDFGFDKYQQSYAVEADIRRQSWSLFASFFAGDLSQTPSERQERGVVVTPVLELGEGAAVGLSALGSVSEARNRGAGSLFGRLPLGGGAYALGEVAAQYFDANEGGEKLSTMAEYLRLGWFVRPEMDLYLEAGHRALLNTGGLIKGRVGVGLNWQVTRWFEFAPQVLAEARSDLPSRILAMAQLHLIY